MGWGGVVCIFWIGGVGGVGLGGWLGLCVEFVDWGYWCWICGVFVWDCMCVGWLVVLYVVVICGGDLNCVWWGGYYLWFDLEWSFCFNYYCLYVIGDLWCDFVFDWVWGELWFDCMVVLSGFDCLRFV